MQQQETLGQKHLMCCFWAFCFVVWIGIANIYLERGINAERINKDFKLPLATAVTEKQVELPSTSKLNLNSHNYKMAFSYVKQGYPALVNNGNLDTKYIDARVGLWTA